MKKSDLQQKMFDQLQSKTIFHQAQNYAFDYSDEVPQMDVFPTEASLEGLKKFDEAMPIATGDATAIIKQLHQLGSPATIAQTGGRYFGFVNGGAIPVSIAAKWLADFWDQNGGLYLTSPINAKLEAICENGLKEILGLPSETVAGFVSGTSMANVCALAAARFRLLKNKGWDINEKGLNGAPPIRIIAHRQVHGCIPKGLAMLGFGQENITWIPADDQGRIIVEHLPELDDSCMVLLQAGNANTGAFDDFETVCTKAQEAGAWVHIDGAFGLWVGATTTLNHLTKGMEKANSWSVDGHKTLNTPYDSGIILCQDAEALISALQATGEYIIYNPDKRDPMLYTPEMSKRSRAIELWVTMKYLGKEGIDEMVTGFYQRAKQLENGLLEHGFEIVNDVVFNQVLVKCSTPKLTNATLLNVQKSGECWCGGSSWAGDPVVRVSVCSWATTEEDIERTIQVFAKAKKEASQVLGLTLRDSIL